MARHERGSRTSTRWLLAAALLGVAAALTATEIQVIKVMSAPPASGKAPWSCINGVNFPVRGNALWDIQCAAEPGYTNNTRCWDSTALDCEAKLVAVNVINTAAAPPNSFAVNNMWRMPVTCGNWMLKITNFSSDGYSESGHWCNIAKAWRDSQGRSLTDGYENCRNGVDDDGNGFTDYWDPACRENMYSLWWPYYATDGIDNDHNGLTDDSNIKCGNGKSGQIIVAMPPPSGNTPGQAIEVCDDGNLLDGDACSSNCLNAAPKVKCANLVMATGPAGELPVLDCSKVENGTTDVNGQQLTWAYDGPCGNALPVGSYQVTMTVTDNYPLAARASCTATVTVKATCGNGVVEDGEACDGAWCTPDCKSVINQPPVAKCKDVTVSSGATAAATGYCGQINANSADVGVDATSLTYTFSVDCNAPLAYGIHPVTMTVTDAGSPALSSSCTATVTVTAFCGNNEVEGAEVCDGTPGCSNNCADRAPVARCKDASVTVDAACNVPASQLAGIDAGTYDPDTGDSISVAYSFGVQASSASRTGPRTAQLVVTDAAGMTSSCAATVTVMDATAPTLTGAAADQCVWPPNKKCACFTTSEFIGGMGMSDNCDSASKLAASAVFLDDCVDSAAPAVAPSANCRARVNGTMLCVVADKVQGRRLLGDASRFYTAHIQVSDASGNKRVLPVTVRVPHDASEGVSSCKAGQSKCAA